MPPSDTQLLIVNADDFGHDREATDLTIACFAAGQISSATAMVQMADSRRAAELALERDLPTGLHLNFTEPFSAAEVPAPARERQLLACRVFGDGGLRLRAWTYDPRIASRVEDAIRDQLEQFRALFGREPTHVDGHNHVQVCPNVARAQALTGFKLRNALWSWPSSRTAMGLARALRRALTARRFPTTRYFLDIAELYRRDSPAELAARLEVAREASVEVMAHPAFGHELQALRDPAWASTIAALPLGSYRDLV
jgi:predicted glycoside hydrolase/deacetylase ChbG (UPF0249 family)